MGELEVARLEKLQLALLTKHDMEMHLSHRISRRNKAAADSTLLSLSHHFPALAVDWQRGNTFSSFPFIFLCSSVHSFYHITSYDKSGTKAHRISLRSFTECNMSEVCLRALLLHDLGLSRDPENLVLLLEEHRHPD